jgi:hypothetical protein
MASFWGLSDGSVAIDTGKEFDAGGGNMEPIPEGTSVLAMPDEVKWATDRNQNEFLSIRWTVLKPEGYQNRKVFQKLWVTDDDPRAKDPSKKRDKALKMLSAIDANAGGKLIKVQGKPSDDTLAVSLINKQMVIRLGLWEMTGDNGDPMSGNYVQAVSGKDRAISEGPKKPDNQGNGAGGRRAPLPDHDLDDDVPFIIMNGDF